MKQDNDHYTELRIFHYSHDTYGLGHIQRTLAIAERLASYFPHATQLVVSDTPQPPCFKLPNRLDFIKLPDMDKSSSRNFHASSPILFFDNWLKHLREKMILDAIRCFNPDLVLANESPERVSKEMLPAFNYLKLERPGTTLVLGMSAIEELLRKKTSLEIESHRKREEYGRVFSYPAYTNTLSTFQ